MSKDTVDAFIAHLDSLGPGGDPALAEADPAAVVAHAAGLGFVFTEDDLRSALNTRICNAESLPRPWGWPAARTFGLVRG